MLPGLRSSVHSPNPPGTRGWRWGTPCRAGPGERSGASRAVVKLSNEKWTFHKPMAFPGIGVTEKMTALPVQIVLEGTAGEVQGSSHVLSLKTQNQGGHNSIQFNRQMDPDFIHIDGSTFLF